MSTARRRAAEDRPNAALWADVQRVAHRKLGSRNHGGRVVEEGGRCRLGRPAPDARARRPGPPRRVVRTVRSAFKEFGALRPPGGLGLLMAAPTILTHGTPEQIDRLVPPILEGQVAGASCSANREPVPTLPGSRPGPPGTATAGSSAVRRSGPVRRRCPTTGCCWPGRTSTCPSTVGSRGSPSVWINRASPSGRCGR